MRSVYFGNAVNQSWITAPQSGMVANATGFVAEGVTLEGRAFVRRSAASHRRFEPAWLGSLNNSDLNDSLQVIKDFADGIYGPGPFFFNDPFSTRSNMMPPNWAAPRLAELDWAPLSDTIVPTFVDAPINNNYPDKYAQYSTAAAYTSPTKLTLIIPTGFTLYFGWHGPSTGSSTGIRIVPYLRTTGGADTALNPTRINAGGTVRTNTSISGTTYSRVEIFLATSAAADVRITGMIAQLLPTGTSVASGGFLSGRGTTGVEFGVHPQIEYYTSEINEGQIGMSTTWIEV